MIIESSGIILLRVPALTNPTEITAGLLIILILLLTIVLRASMSSAVAIIGSIPDHGVEPCVCSPLILILYADAAAMAGPEVTDKTPFGMLVTCNPKITSGLCLSKIPSANIISAPPPSPSGGPSSAG